MQRAWPWRRLRRAPPCCAALRIGRLHPGHDDERPTRRHLGAGRRRGGHPRRGTRPPHRHPDPRGIWAQARTFGTARCTTSPLRWNARARWRRALSKVGPRRCVLRRQGGWSRTRESLSVQGPLQPGTYELDANGTSQVITGLLCSLPLLEGDSKLTLHNVVSTPYMEMTLEMMEDFGLQVDAHHVEDSRTWVLNIPGHHAPRLWT